jgi:predicted kinase
VKEVLNRSFYGLVVVFGLPGSGKSTLAGALANTIHAIHLNTDIIRSESGLKGRYRADDKAAVYAALLGRAKQGLETGSTVILDGTFSLEDQREQVRALALAKGVSLVWIEVRADEQVIKHRVSVSRPYTEADYTVYELIRSQWKPLEEPHLILQTDRNAIPDCVQKAMDWIYISSPKDPV